MNRKIQGLEHIIHSILWMCVFLLAIMFTYDNGMKWNRVYFEWIRLSPFLFIFLLNNFIVVPFLLLKKKYVWYGLTIIGAIVLVVFLQRLITPLDMLFSDVNREIPGGSLPAPRFHPPGSPEIRDAGRMVGIFNHVVISVLIIGFNTGIKLFVRSVNDERIRVESQKQQLKTELAFLKYQISPHFFMNTLNNIHALVDLDPKDAKDAIIKLSALMRYLLYESEKDGKSSLNKEIQFIRNYIELMKLRYDSSRLTIQFNYPENQDNVEVPPLIFLSFIENAFKHGVGYQGQATIKVELSVQERWLDFFIRNTLPAEKAQAKTESSGVGLENVKKRLELIYGNRYELQLVETSTDFDVSLKIPIS